LPKSASSDFWVRLLPTKILVSVAKYLQTTFVGIQDQESSLQASIDSALQQLGPLLAQALIYNIGGNAARSELDKLCDPLKKLVIRQVRSKAWLEAALRDDGFPSDKVVDKDKMVFLQKIMRYVPFLLW